MASRKAIRRTRNRTREPAGWTRTIRDCRIGGYSTTRSSLIHVPQAFVELDRCAPWVGHEGDSQSERLRFAIGHVQLDAHRFELLAEGCQISDLEADVIERAPRGADHRIGRGREVERDAR